MRVNPLLVPILFVAAFLGAVVIAQSAGLWSTSGRASANLDQLAPADVKGWMTLQQVADSFGLSQTELYALVNIPADVPATTALKDVEKLAPGFEVSALREALEALPTPQQPAAPPTVEPALPDPTPTGIPASPTPDPGDANPDQNQSKGNVGQGAAEQVGEHAGPTPLPPGEVLPGSQIKGRMSLQEISDLCAVPLDALLAALALPADTDTTQPIRQLASQGQIAGVSNVQQAVTELQSK
jgi:hypothetical protein